MSGLGPSFLKIWTCGSSPRSGSRNARTRIENVNRASRLSNLWNFIFSARSKWIPVAIGGHGRTLIISLWPGDKATFNRVVALRLTPPLPPKIPSTKFRMKISCLDSIFWDGSRRHPSHWLSSKGPNYQCGEFLISASVIEGHFEGKTPRKVHQGRLVLARQCPSSPGTCNPEESGIPGIPMYWSTTLFSLVAIFCHTWRSLLPRTPGSTENIPNSFERLSNIKATG
jgi:hypothetical protein